MLNLQKVQVLCDKFAEYDNPEIQEELKLDQETVIKVQSLYFSKLYDTFCKAVGQFYVIYQRMLYHKERSNKIQESLDQLKSMTKQKAFETSGEANPSSSDQMGSNLDCEPA